MNAPLRVRRGAKVLLLNPPVADTIEAEERDLLTCVEPMGLLRLGAYFRERGCRVQWIDCLRDPLLGGRLRRHRRKLLACGGPGSLTQKPIHHFGLNAEELARRLKECEPPDLIAAGAVMTWHIDSAREALRVCKEVYPQARLLLGGNLATLCPDQARQSAADQVVSGELPGAAFLPTAIDLMEDRSRDYLRLVKGCPYHCSYCATRTLNEGVVARDPEAVFAEMKDKIKRYGTKTFVFFDDFILYRPERHLLPFLKLVAEEKPGVVLEFGLGFNAAMLTEDLVGRLRQAGVVRMAVALETIDESRCRDMRRPHYLKEFARAVSLLRSFGYRGHELRVFLLMGLPDQTMNEILNAILFLLALGVAPSLTSYALTPGTKDMERLRPRVPFRELDELAPGLWRFANERMPVDDLEKVYRAFHEKYYPLEEAAAHAGVGARVQETMKRLIRERAYVHSNW